MHKTTLAPGQLLHPVHMEKGYLGKVGYLVLYNARGTMGNPPLEVAPAPEEIHVNSYRR